MRVSSLVLTTAMLGWGTLLGASTAVYGQTQVPTIRTVAYRQGVAHQVKETFRDTTDALNITPNVKGAIIADKFLNNRRNHINVGTKDFVLHLTGHVYSQGLRSRATSIAARKLKEMHKNYTISNELSVVH